MKHQSLRHTLGMGWILCIALGGACSTDNNDEVPDDTPTATGQASVTVMFSAGGLGDNGYNDLILRGVQQVYLMHSDATVAFYAPASEAEAETRFRNWWQQESAGADRELYVLAGSDYTTLAAACDSAYGALPEGKEVLLFESDELAAPQVASFRISMYGAAYLGGLAVRQLGCQQPLVLLANATDRPIRTAADGFSDGYGVETDLWGDLSQARVAYLADDWQGYAMADSAYRLMETYLQSCDFVFGLAGGSNAGIYRYFRELEYASNSKRYWTAGVDVDQSAYSSRVVGSLVKHIDLVVEDYLGRWIHGDQLPHHQVYGLDSQYVEWLISAEYQEYFGDFVEEHLSEAITKEQAYEDKN
jgi:basic membrane protein A